MAREADALEETYRLHAATVFRRARHLLGDDDEAHEVVHDVFLSLFERPEQFMARSSLVTFLYSATTHACLNRIRQKRTRARLLEQRVRPAEAARDRGMAPEERMHLHALLARMPEDYAQLLIYSCIDDLTHDEIAQLIGCSRRQVGKLLERVAAWAAAQETRTCET